MSQDEVFGLASIDRGGALEVFDSALQEVLDNCQDPNTSPEATRTVTLTLKIKPNARRNSATMTYAVKAGTAPPMAAEVPLFLGKVNGKGWASQFTPPGQVTMDEQIAQARAEQEQPAAPVGGEPAEGANNVTPLRGGQ
jgi:hypothetical protein